MWYMSWKVKKSFDRRSVVNDEVHAGELLRFSAPMVVEGEGQVIEWSGYELQLLMTGQDPHKFIGRVKLRQSKRCLRQLLQPVGVMRRLGGSCGRALAGQPKCPGQAQVVPVGQHVNGTAGRQVSRLVARCGAKNGIRRGGIVQAQAEGRSAVLPVGSALPQLTRPGDRAVQFCRILNP